METELRTLSPGADYPSAADEKLAHAELLSEALMQEVQECLDLAHEAKRVEFSEDQRVVSVYFDYQQEFMPQRLNAKFGDIVHNYRSGLDALAWGLAHLDGAEPRRPKQVYFPFCLDEAEWEKSVRERLDSIPEWVLARIRRVQPFHGRPARKGIGVVLNAISNGDKHRGASSLALHIRKDFDRRVNYRLKPSAFGLHGSPMRRELVFRGSLFSRSELAIRFHSEQPFELFEFVSDPFLQMRAEFEGEYFELGSLLRSIHTQVQETYRVVTTGRFSWEEGIDVPTLSTLGL